MRVNLTTAKRGGVGDETPERSSLAQARLLAREWKILESPSTSHIVPDDFNEHVTADELLARALEYMAKRDVERLRLKYLRVSIEIGSTRSLRARVAMWEEFFMASPNDQVQDEFQAIKASLEGMRDIEKTHGIGALLNLKHPVVVGLSQTPGSWIGPSEVQAARSYQGLTEGGSFGANSSMISSMDA